MSRRQVIEDPVNHDRWLVSYADFITLLFAFFVVMYSISQINENKYRILSNTLEDAFNQTAAVIDPFQVGETPRSNPISLIKLNDPAIEEREQGKEDDGSGLEEETPGGMPNEFKEINDKIEQGFGELLNDKLITVRGNEEWLEVELKSSLLFDSGDAELSNDALELLAEIAGILKDDTNPIRVEGFTDNVPINNVQFPSNWELSTARAAAVISLFVEEGLSPERLAAIGYGEFQPIADNNTEQGRADNRRVVLMISKTGQLRPNLEEVEATPQPVEIPLPFPVDPILNTEPQVEPPLLEASGADDQNTELAEDLPAPLIQPFQTIELEGGGLLFTSEPREEEQP